MGKENVNKDSWLSPPIVMLDHSKVAIKGSNQIRHSNFVIEHREGKCKQIYGKLGVRSHCVCSRYVESPPSVSRGEWLLGGNQNWKSLFTVSFNIYEVPSLLMYTHYTKFPHCFCVPSIYEVPTLLRCTQWEIGILYNFFLFFQYSIVIVLKEEKSADITRHSNY